MPEAHAGLELSIYPTAKFENALQGKFAMIGGGASAGFMDLSAGLIKTNDGKLTGVQFSVVLSTPSLAKTLPTAHGFAHGGMGQVEKVYSSNYKWWLNQ